MPAKPAKSLLAKHLLVVAFVGLLVTPALGEDGAAKVSLNVRASPGTDQPIVGGLAPGEPVTISQCDKGWCQISALNVAGWVAEAYLQRTKFTQSWSAVSPDLPATIPNGNANVSIGVQLNLEVGKKRRGH